MSTGAMHVFDRRLVRAHRDRAAAGLDGHGALLREVAGRLTERLEDVRRRFPLALDLGCHGGEVAAALAGRGGVETLWQADLSPAMARRAAARPHRPAGPVLAADEEALPFAADSFDLVLSCLSLHWVNDLPGALVQLRQCLKPDGLLMAAMLGGATLHELRTAWMEAEFTEEGGAGPHVSPFADVRDAGDLLQRAGFALPVVDIDRVTVTYDTPLALMQELKAMGEANALFERRRQPLTRRVLMRAMALYQDRFGRSDGRVPATFEIVYLAGWAPHESQQKPLPPGSARQRLAEALGTTEVSAGEKAGPESKRR